MHPIERLRYVARASGADQRLLVRETAGALRGLGVEPAGLVTSGRRIVERHPSSGPLWWLCARVLTAADPFRAARECVDEIEADPTPEHLMDALPGEAAVLVLGWPDLIGDVLVRRGDLAVFAVEAGNETAGLVRRLERADVDVVEVGIANVGGAAASADIVLIEASAVGPDGALCVAGSRAAAAVAYCAEIPVWLVNGVGRSLPEPMWNGMLGELGRRGQAWELDDEVVPLGLVSHIVDSRGLRECDGTLTTFDTPLAHELIPKGR